MEAILEEPAIVPEKSMSAAAKTMKEGAYPGMPREEYDLAPGISHSMLKVLNEGKKTLLTRRLLIGNMLHHLCQSKELAGKAYFTIDQDMDLRTPEAKAKLKEAKELTGKIPVLPRERGLVANMYKALLSHKYGNAFIKHSGEREVAIFAKISGEPDNKIFNSHHTLCKGIIDLQAKFIWDLKTCHYTNEQDFRHNIVNHGYDSQAAMYRELHAAITHEFKPFYWLCVSTQAPHNVFVVECTPYMLACGLRWVNTMLNRYERTIDKDKLNENE